VRPGAEEELAQRLARLREEESPFARMPGVHFARWLLLPADRLQLPDSDEGPPFRVGLLFSATVDDEEAFLDGLRTALGAVPDDVWGCCVGYPGRQHRTQFRRWLATHRLPVHRSFAAYEDAPVERVRAALDLRAAHIAFAARIRELEPGAWQGAFLEHFKE
jgi:hypothetical protein